MAAPNETPPKPPVTSCYEENSGPGVIAVSLHQSHRWCYRWSPRLPNPRRWWCMAPCPDIQLITSWSGESFTEASTDGTKYPFHPFLDRDSCPKFLVSKTGFLECTLCSIICACHGPLVGMCHKATKGPDQAHDDEFTCCVCCGPGHDELKTQKHSTSWSHSCRESWSCPALSGVRSGKKLSALEAMTPANQTTRSFARQLDMFCMFRHWQVGNSKIAVDRAWTKTAVGDSVGLIKTHVFEYLNAKTSSRWMKCQAKDSKWTFFYGF